MGSSTTRRCMALVATIVQAIAAIAMSYLIFNRLWTIEADPETGEFTEGECLLGVGDKTEHLPADTSLCGWSVAALAITFVILLALSILQCLTCQVCGAGFIIDAVVYAFLTLVWLSFAAIVTDAVRTIDGWDNVPEWNSDDVANGRTIVMGLCWVQAVAFAVLSLTSFFTLCCKD